MIMGEERMNVLQGVDWHADMFTWYRQSNLILRIIIGWPTYWSHGSWQIFQCYENHYGPVMPSIWRKGRNFI